MSFLKSETIKNEINPFTENAIGVFMKDPVSIVKFLEEIKSFPSRIRDAIYWENFTTYIFRVYDYDEEKSMLVDKYKKKLSEMLAENTPNEDSDYTGNTNRLRENVKRLIKLLADAETTPKAVYYANLTRAALNDLITRDKFFKLCKCVSELTEEDICLFINNITRTQTATIKDDLDFIDDFRSVGLLKEVSDGFSYTSRAFELLKYGLKYEDNIKIPAEIQERVMVGPGMLGSIEDEVLTVKRS